MASALSAVLCLAIGYAVTGLGLGRQMPRVSDVLLRLCLSAGFGFGLFSTAFFLARVCNVSGVSGLWGIDFAVCAVSLAAWVLFTVRSAPVTAPSSSTCRESAPRPLIAAFVVALLAALYAAIARALGRPYGSGWDSFAIWNLHARFLFRDVAHWRDAFSPLILWSHPDYPLLLPAAIAHFWTLSGHESTAVPVIIGLVFTFGTAAMLFSALDVLAGRTSALLGGLALLSTPFYIDLGTWQYADIPLSFFFLATLVLIHLHENAAGKFENATKQPGNDRDFPGQLVLAGLAVGFAVWTKNEGSLFLCAMLVSRLLVGSGQQFALPATDSSRPFPIIPVLLGAAPLILLVAVFKHFFAPPGDLFSDPATMLHKLRDISRYGVVLKWFGREFLRFGDWLFLPIPLLMIFFYLIVKAHIRPRSSTGFRASTLMLGLTLAGYFFIYLITPYDIYWHLRFSLARLFLQLWPSAIFLFFLKTGALPPRIRQANSCP